jgi:catechol 2,3-dioxygenase-like lactoylglutathione lyase family enzyme
MPLYFYAPVIFVDDIERSKQFYIENLDQEIEHDFGNNIIFKSHLSLWKIESGHEIHKIAGSSKNGNAFELYFETEDIQKTAALIKENKIRVLHDLKTEPWGQMTLRFFDPNDHLIEIGESFTRFITRIYSETGSTAETAMKTGVKEEVVKKIVA